MWQEDPQKPKAKGRAKNGKKELDEKGKAKEPLELCWICVKRHRQNIKKKECVECGKDWDAMHADAKRKKEIEFLKEFKKTMTDEQGRRMLFTWKKARKKDSGKPKNLFPWASVSRRWTVKKNLTAGKGGKLKTYHSFCKWYVEMKGWEPERAHKHWDRRASDKHWRKGVDPEDRPHCHIVYEPRA